MRLLFRWTVAIIIAFVLISLSSKDNFYESSKSSLLESISTMKNKVPSLSIGKDVVCERWAEELIPKKITLFYRGDQFSGEIWQIKNFVWADNTKANEANIVGIQYKPGNSANQNVNHYYPSKLVTDDFYIKYDKTVIESNGEILGKNSFAVVLVLKPIDNTDGKWQVWSDSKYPTYDTKDFEIVDYSMLYCDFIK